MNLPCSAQLTVQRPIHFGRHVKSLSAPSLHVKGSCSSSSSHHPPGFLIFRLRCRDTVVGEIQKGRNLLLHGPLNLGISILMP